MITTDNDEIAEKCFPFKHFGAKGASFETVGTNYKLSNVLSAIGLIQMKKIEKIINDRIEKAKIYEEILSDINGIKPAYVGSNTRQTFQSYTCYVEKEGYRDKIRNALASASLMRIKTNSLGEGNLSNLASGRYYIIGASTLGQVGVVWSKPITLNSGDNRISLDLRDAVWAQ